ncbi:hypothetical protein HK102_012281, partial [Quaeritorhiza haematococci]
MHVSVFSRKDDMHNLLFSPYPIFANKSQRAELQIRRRIALKDSKETLQLQTSFTRVDDYWDDLSLIPLDWRPYYKYHLSSMYLHINLANFVYELPARFQMNVEQETPSVTIFDVFSGIGGVFSVISLILIILFGYRRVRPFGLVHKVFHKSVFEYLES